MEESSRCCSPTTSSPAAACPLREVVACRSSRVVRYWSSSFDRRISGASDGRSSIITLSTIRLGNPPWISRMSSLSRRTITSSSSPFPRIFTPRVNRYGSSSSSRVEKLFEWPLWGVAERNSRCSKRPHRSRIARVNLFRFRNGPRSKGPRGGLRRGSADCRAATRPAIPASDRRTRDRSAGCARSGSGCGSATGSPRTHARGEPAPGSAGRGSRRPVRSAPPAPLSTAPAPRGVPTRRWFWLSSATAAPGDQPGLDRLPEPGVVGDEQVNPGQTAAPCAGAPSGKRRS